MNTDDITPDEPDEGASTPTDRRPLGAWMRLVDALITREFAAAFEGEEVSRRDWMLLGAIAGTVDAPWITEKLARGGKRLHHLIELGWVDQDAEGAWILTDEGRAAQERLAEKVAAVRSKVAGTVSPDEFAALTASLEKIARGLGWDESQPMPRRPRGFGRGRLGGRHGFVPGFGPHGFGHQGFGAPGVGPHGFGPHGFGAPGVGPHGFGPHGFGPHGFGPHGVGRHECMHGEFGHGHHGHGAGAHGKSGHRRAERAYERGFTAGFAAAERGADSADTGSSEPTA